MSTSPDSSREDSQLKPLLSHCSGDDTLIDPIQFMFSEEGKGGLPNFDTQLYESFGEDSDDDSIFSGISDSASDTESHREEEPKPLPSLNNGELPTDSPITAQSHTAECKSPPSLNRGELQAQMKAMVKVGIFDVFGISGDICYPRVSLDFSWPNPPSIHLTIKGPSNVVFYDNRWELDAYACSAFACQDLQVCSLPEATKHLSSGDVDIMADELGGEHPTDVVCMRFTSWPRITGRTIEGNLITSLGGLDTSFKQSLAILSKPQAPFEITIAFRPPHPWPEVNEKVLSYFIAASQSRIKPLDQWRDKEGIFYSKSQAKYESMTAESQDLRIKALERELELLRQAQVQSNISTSLQNVKTDARRTFAEHCRLRVAALECQKSKKGLHDVEEESEIRMRLGRPRGRSRGLTGRAL